MTTFDNLTIIDKLNITLSSLNMTYLVGKIKIYAGSSLPDGYVWCDGTNGTPDLLGNQFIISDQSDGTQQQTGNNYFTNNMISHTHNVTSAEWSSQLSTSNVFNSGSQQMSLAPYFNVVQGITSQKITYIGNAPVPAVNTDVNGTRTGLVSTQHLHNITNEDVVRQVNIQAKYTHTTTFTENAKNVTIGNTGNDTEYVPPYMYIGFIMKDPNTWL